jgi:hypothetical protein
VQDKKKYKPQNSNRKQQISHSSILIWQPLSHGRTGKSPDKSGDFCFVHGILHKLCDLHKYSVDELKIFLEELKISVAERGRLNGIKGADPAHGRRVADEHELIRTIEKIFENLGL